MKAREGPNTVLFRGDHSSNFRFKKCHGRLARSVPRGAVNDDVPFSDYRQYERTYCETHLLRDI